MGDSQEGELRTMEGAHMGLTDLYISLWLGTLSGGLAAWSIKD